MPTFVLVGTGPCSSGEAKWRK